MTRVDLRVEGDVWGRGGSEKGLRERGKLIHSMGLVWKEVRILAHRATTPCTVITFFALITTFGLAICCIYCKYVFELFLLFSSFV
jgi:hypothetical protein